MPANLASFGDIDALVGLAARARRWAQGPRRSAPRPVHADAARAVRRAAHDRRRVGGRRRLRDGAAPPAPRRPAPHRDPRGTRAALRPAPALAQPRRLRRRRAVRRDQGRARGPAAPRAQPNPGARNATLLAPRIGWVRGTGLMGANDALAPLVEERLGVRTFAAAEMGWLLAALVAPEVRAHAPLEIDVSGGLSHAPGSARRARTARRRAARPVGARSARRHRLERALTAPAADDAVEALPAPGTDAAPRALPPDAPEHGLAPEDLVVIVGTGELGPGGTGRTRFALELDELDSPGVGRRARVAVRARALRGRSLSRPLDRHRDARRGARGAPRRALRGGRRRPGRRARARTTTARSTPTVTPCSRRSRSSAS